MRRAAFLAAALLGALAGLGSGAEPAAPATPAVHVSGAVVDGAGRPVEFAALSIPALKRGTATDEQGRFALDLPPGPLLLVAMQVGYEPSRTTVEVRAGMAPLRLVLREQAVPVAEVSVSASSFGKSGRSEGAVLNRMDIYMTPGGAADVFQALRALPGINAPNEGAAVYVRGGDPHETLIRIDGGELGHPYHFEGASGGLFSGFDTYLLKSSFFSSGGFSAKYGGALSGVLDIETQDPLTLRSVSVGANLAGGSVSSSWALVPEKLSLIGAFSLSSPGLLFRLYGRNSDYDLAPASGHGALKALWRYSPTGRLSASYLGSGDDIAVVARRWNYEGTYAARARNHWVGLALQDLVAERLSLKGFVATQRYRSRWSYGDFAGSRDEDNAEAQLDAVWAASGRHELSFGGDWRRRDTDLASRSPADSTDYAPGAAVRDYATRARLRYPGAYAEDKLRVVGPLYATLGGRADHLSSSGTWTLDPRAALAWRIDARHTLRLATGVYHQPPDAEFLDPVYGNPALAPLAATHWIVGYEWLERDVNLRIEAFRKDYRDLVTNQADTFYGNRGRGFAQGVDLFLRGAQGPVQGWLSYGYLDSKRMERDDPRELPSAYGVRHSLSLVGSYRLDPAWTVGARYSLSSGRPYRPVVGRTYDPATDTWHPVLGENNSAWMPGFNRLDVRLTHLFHLPAMAGLPESGVCVAYLEAINVLGIRNVLEYQWTPDYSRRIEQRSYFSRRLLVLGVGLAW